MRRRRARTGAKPDRARSARTPQSMISLQREQISAQYGRHGTSGNAIAEPVRA